MSEVVSKFGITVEQIFSAARRQVENWKDLTNDALTLSPLSGGMSNEMWVVTCTAPQPGGGPNCVVARLLSPQLDNAIDRVQEMQIVKFISTTGIGPRLFGSAMIELDPDDVGAAPYPRVMLRFEEFIKGRTLNINDLRTREDIAISMARKIAQLHAQRPKLRRASSSAAPGPIAAAASAAAAAAATAPASPSIAAAVATPAVLPAERDVAAALPGQLRRYLALVALIDKQKALLQAVPRGASILSLLQSQSWEGEAAWLVELMAAHGGEVVLAHGDLQEGNWIEAEGEDTNGTGAAVKELFLIDYEYAGYSYRGYDTGNLMCEHTADYAVGGPPGFAIDTAAYPSLAWQRAFFGAYDAEWRRLHADDDDPDAIHYHRKGSGGPDATPSPAAVRMPVPSLRDRTTLSRASLEAHLPPALRELASEARVGVLASHLYWALWSVVMAAGKVGVPSARKGSKGQAVPSPAPAPAPAPADPPAAGAAAAGAAAGAASEAAAEPDAPGSDAVATGAPHFDYALYGSIRSNEYSRLKRELMEDAPHLLPRHT